ncbi:MAG: hypothetical protein RB191_17445, partial [Terriglobia bacterium]|nr:hypothetical protein [Terriglobia bacterium]
GRAHAGSPSRTSALLVSHTCGERQYLTAVSRVLVMRVALAAGSERFAGYEIICKQTVEKRK